MLAFLLSCSAARLPILSVKSEAARGNFKGVSTTVIIKQSSLINLYGLDQLIHPIALHLSLPNSMEKDNSNPLVSEIALPTRRRHSPETAKQNDDSIHALWQSLKSSHIVDETEIYSSSSDSESVHDGEPDVDPIDSQEIYGKSSTVEPILV